MPSGGILRRISEKIAARDRRCQNQRPRSTAPAVKPKEHKVTNVAKTYTDENDVVRIATRKLNADEIKKIAKFRNSDSGEPRSS